MTYNIDFTDLALRGLVKLAKSEPKTYQNDGKTVEKA